MRIEAQERKEGGFGDCFEDVLEASECATEPFDDDEPSTCIKFSAGNPRVEHITGVVHLYRDISGVQDASKLSAIPFQGPSPPTANPTFAQTVAGPGHGAITQPCSNSAPLSQTQASSDACASSSVPPLLVDMLCCLAIPGDMSVAEFCTFCGAYLVHIREMRVLRREASTRVVCMVLVRFDAAEHAQSFFEDFNNKPVRE